MAKLGAWLLAQGLDPRTLQPSGNVDRNGMAVPWRELASTDDVESHLLLMAKASERNANRLARVVQPVLCTLDIPPPEQSSSLQEWADDKRTDELYPAVARFLMTNDKLAITSNARVLPHRLARVAASAAMAEVLASPVVNGTAYANEGKLCIGGLRDADLEVDNVTEDPDWMADEDDVVVYHMDNLDDNEGEVEQLTSRQRKASLRLLAGVEAANVTALANPDTPRAPEDAKARIARVLAMRAVPAYQKEGTLLFGTLDIVALETKRVAAAEKRRKKPAASTERTFGKSTVRSAAKRSPTLTQGLGTHAKRPARCREPDDDNDDNDDEDIDLDQDWAPGATRSSSTAQRTQRVRQQAASER